MYEKFTIRSVKLTKSKKGDCFIVIEGVTDSGAWEKDWIGKTAPSSVIERWWKSAGVAKYGWSDFASPAAFDLVGKEVLVKFKSGDYGNDVEEVRSLDFAETQEKPAQTEPDAPMRPSEDDIPF